MLTSCARLAQQMRKRADVGVTLPDGGSFLESRL